MMIVYKPFFLFHQHVLSASRSPATAVLFYFLSFIALHTFVQVTLGLECESFTRHARASELHWWYSRRDVRSMMSLSPQNNINNLRVQPGHVALPCGRSLIHFPAGATQTRSSGGGTVSPVLRSLLSISETQVITVYPSNDFP